jgi:prephenate dehydrogenase
MTSPSEGPERPSEREAARRAAVVGTGLIGGSIALALRRRGWYVTGTDNDAARAARALELGALDAVGIDTSAAITFIATPVSAVADAAKRALAGDGVVTDVGSVKRSIVDAIDNVRFVGGHPMAGSEQEGVDGATADLFEGSTWVLTPTLDTDADAYATVRTVISSLGADVIALPPERHDTLVALVSHVPHLTAATLMGLAAEGAEEHATVLRLAAGGFRDMTRIAAGHPGIWPDICRENREAIVAVLDQLIGSLQTMREVVGRADRDALLATLEGARAARVNLPATVGRAEELIEMRVPVPDRPGVIAEVTTLASELSVNIVDLEIAHSAEGERGVLLLVIDALESASLGDALSARGYHPATRPLS